MGIIVGVFASVCVGVGVDKIAHVGTDMSKLGMVIDIKIRSRLKGLF